MIGKGCTLTGSVHGVIGKLTNVDFSGLVSDEIDVTNFDSDDYNEYEAGFIDSGTLTADLLYVPATFNTIIDAFAAANELWTLALNDSRSLFTHGHIRSVAFSLPLRDAAKTPIEIRCSGKPWFPSSSSSSCSSSSSSSSSE